MKKNQGKRIAIKITDEEVIVALSDRLGELISSKIAKDSTSQKILKEIFNKKVASNLEFWQVSIELGRELLKKEELVFNFGEQFSIWVKDINRKSIPDLRIDIECLFNEEVTLFSRAFLYASKVFLKNPLPDDFATFSKRQILNFIEDNKQPPKHDTPAENIFRAMKEFAEVLLVFSVYVLTTDELENDLLIQSIKDFKKEK